jgi:hypothetical protein
MKDEEIKKAAEEYSIAPHNQKVFFDGAKWAAEIARREAIKDISRVVLNFKRDWKRLWREQLLEELSDLLTDQGGKRPVAADNTSSKRVAEIEEMNQD